MRLESAIAPEQLAADLAARLAALQRVLRKRTRASLGPTLLSPAQVELLRLLAAQPGLGAGEAAQELQLAPNTVSTLAAQLVAQGLVTTERNAHDARRVHLGATAAGKRRLERWRTQRAHFLAEALESLSDDEQHTLESVLPLLTEITQILGSADAA